MNAENTPNLEHAKKQENRIVAMLRGVWNSLTKPAGTLTDISEQRNARLASSFLLAIAALNFVGILARIPRVGFGEAFLGPIGYSGMVLVFTYLLSRSRWYRAAVFLFSLMFSALAYVSIISQGSNADQGGLVLIYVPLSLIVATSFLSGWAVFLLVGINIGAYLITQSFGASLPENIGAQAGIITIIGVVLILLKNFQNATEIIRLEELRTVNRELDSLSSELEQRVKERTEELQKSTQELEKTLEENTKRAQQLEAIAIAARTIATLEDVNDLLPNITELVSDRFGFYHVGIFLLDAEKKYAVLRASNSEGGQAMLARAHKLRVGQEGVVGYAVAEKQARIALDVGQDAVYFDNPDLPATHSEMALPLMIGNNAIGVLDIQSEQAGAFTEEDTKVLSTLADQIAVAIENARLFAQSRETLEELERTFQQYIRSEWQRFIEVSNVKGYVAYQTGVQPIKVPLQNDDKPAKSDTVFPVPVKLRGVIVGHVNVDLGKPVSDYTGDELDIINAAVERFTLALENARLLETTSRRARRERLVSEITTKIRSTNNPNEMVKTAMEELKKVLGASKVELQAFQPEGDQTESSQDE